MKNKNITSYILSGIILVLYIFAGVICGLAGNWTALIWVAVALFYTVLFFVVLNREAKTIDKNEELSDQLKKAWQKQDELVERVQEVTTENYLLKGELLKATDSNVEPEKTVQKKPARKKTRANLNEIKEELVKINELGINNKKTEKK